MKLAAILLGVAVVYIGTWSAFGERALLDRDARLIWTDADITRYSRLYGEELPHVLCTDLTDRRTIERYGRTARVLSWEECFGDRSDALRLAEAATVPEDSELGLIVGTADLAYPNPFLAKNEVGIWFYGTDYTEYRVEWVTWAFVGWLSLFGREIGLGQVSSEEDA